MKTNQKSFLLLTHYVNRAYVNKNDRQKLRYIREEKELPLQKFAALLYIDVAILSKMERGERKITKKVVLKLADIYDYNADELLLLFLSDKILYEIQDEDLGIEALKVAEERAKYIKANKKK